jgi:hypothetical protein
LRVSAVNRLGWTCVALIAIMIVLAIPLRCLPRAVGVAAGSSCGGAALGLSLAMVTRTRQPLAIYAWLAAAGLSFYPLFAGWPPADSWDLTPWHGAPEFLNNYFDLLRPAAYLLAMPYPFARLGQHAPDRVGSGPSDEDL